MFKKKFDLNLNLSQPLPPKMTVMSAGNHFYKIGLSLFVLNSTKRSALYNPYFVFIIDTILIVRSIIALTIDNPNLSLMIGDFSYFLNLKIHFNIVIISNLLFCNVAQLIHLFNYKNGIKPNYLKPFEMIAGLTSPKSVGLVDSISVNKLLQNSRKIIYLNETIFFYMAPIYGFLLCFVPLA